jgi:hypothetical protein
MGRGWLSSIVAIAGVAAACSNSAGEGDAGSAPQTALAAVTYIGVVEGSETRIALVEAAGAIQGYVCGRGETLESHTRWFEGELGGPDAGTAELTSDDWQLQVRVATGRLNGELIAPNGDALRWSAERVGDSAASEVGLYESFDTGCRSGVIVWEAIAGPACRAQGAWCDGTGTRGQVTPAECIAGEPLRVFGDDDGERFELIAERVRGS